MLQHRALLLLRRVSGYECRGTPQRSHTRGPPCRFRQTARSPLCVVESVLYEGVVERPVEERPGDPRPACESGFQYVHELRRTSAPLEQVELVEAVESARLLEAEPNPLSRLVEIDPIADRSVTAAGTHLQRAIEVHGRPAVTRPELIVMAREPVDQLSDAVGWVYFTAMDVAYAHGASK
jgi:hypothetical protein